MKQVASRQQKIAAVYDSDIWPLIPARGAALIARALPRRPASVVLEVGCATGRLALALAEQLDDASRVVGLDSSRALIEIAEAEGARRPAGARVSFRVGNLHAPAATQPTTTKPTTTTTTTTTTNGAAEYDAVVSNLTVGDASDPAAAVADLARQLKPGGRAILTVPLRGSWTELLDIYGDVLTEQGKSDARAALAAYRAGQPDGETAAQWLESAGLRDVTVETERFEILFKSAREFFFSPVVELGPLPAWKQIAGRGDEMQDMFFFVKEAIEAYFAGGVFPATIVLGCLQGTKPAASAAG